MSSLLRVFVNIPVEDKFYKWNNYAFLTATFPLKSIKTLRGFKKNYYSVFE
jgi:hypothetical protein